MPEIQRPVRVVDARRPYRLGEEDAWKIVDATGRTVAECPGITQAPWVSPEPSQGWQDAEAIAAALNARCQAVTLRDLASIIRRAFFEHDTWDGVARAVAEKLGVRIDASR